MNNPTENPGDVTLVMGDAEMASELLSGHIVEGIRLIRSLGAGGMGEVYLGEDVRLERKVAVKTIRGQRRLDEGAKQRFRREALILSSLDHPGICRVYSLLEAESVDFLVLEYLPGKSLGEWLEGEVSHRRKLAVAAAILDALSAAHQADVVHRDLKPDNIMILDNDQVKVLDFGISRVLSDAPPPGSGEAEPAEADTARAEKMVGTLR
ncbi:MAG: serine/threonine protein kinase, partial [Xanthomonadales bacterium]|nr:serine/threonine protein kinase [Xanthomonadales bacterium]